MVDKIKPLKLETATDGTEFDFSPRELDPSEDFVATKGVAFENSDLITLQKDSYQNIKGLSLASVMLSKQEIDTTISYTIPEKHQLAVYECITLTGDLTLDGDLVVYN